MQLSFSSKQKHKNAHSQPNQIESIREKKQKCKNIKTENNLQNKDEKTIFLQFLFGFFPGLIKTVS